MKSIKLILLLLTVSSMATAQTNSLRVWMDDPLTMTADGATVMYLTVCENDPNSDYTSFNMNITLPKGVSISQKKSGRETVNEIEMSERAATTHVIECNMPDERTLKIIAYSTGNDNLYNTDYSDNPLDELFTVGLKCDPSAINGEYKIELTECVFTKAEGNTFVGVELDHTEYSTLTVSGGTDFAGVDYTLSELGCGTLMLPLDCAIPTGMKAYVCYGLSADNVLQMNEVNSIEANIPYIVRGTPGTYHFTGTYKALKDSYSTDYMTGVFAETDAPLGAYVMQNHADTYGIGFYRVGSVAAKVPAYRAYVNSQTSAARMLMMDFDNVTGVEDVQEEQHQSVNVCTMQGIVVKRGVEKSHALDNLPHGIYIVDGKRYVVTGK